MKMISYGLSERTSAVFSSLTEKGRSLKKAALPAILSVIFARSRNWLEPVTIYLPGKARVLSTWSLIASKISGTFCASSIIAPSGKAAMKSLGFDAASSRIVRSSNETYFLCGKAAFASVVFPLCRGPVTPTTGNWAASRSNASLAIRSII